MSRAMASGARVTQARVDLNLDLNDSPAALISKTARGGAEEGSKTIAGTGHEAGRGWHDGGGRRKPTASLAATSMKHISPTCTP